MMAKSTAWLGVGLIVVIAVLLFMLFASSGRFVVGTIDYVTANLVNVSGVSPFLARGLVILATIPFFWAVAKYTRTIVGYRRLKPSLTLYTNRYGIIIVSYVAAFFLTMYFASRQAYFGLTSGETLKWCAESVEGIRVFDSPGVDPVYGRRLAPCTPEQIITLRDDKLGLRRPQLLAIDTPRSFEFFETLSGRPKVWYWRASNGTYELFDRPGRHPRTNAELLPVTPDVVAEVTRLKAEEAIGKAKIAEAEEVAKLRREQDAKAEISRAARNAHREKYVNPVSGAGSEPVVAAVGANGIDDALSAALAEAIRGRSDILKPAFVSDGLFTRAMQGDTAAFGDLDLDRVASVVVLASIHVSNVLDSAVGEKVVKSEARVSIRVFRPVAGFSSQVWTTIGNGVAFSETVAAARARTEAIEKAVALLKTVSK